MRRVVGIDVGGTKRAAVILDGSGATLATAWAEHQGAWQGRIVETAAQAVESVVSDAGMAVADVAAIGVAVAGLVSSDRSTLVHSPIIRETHVDLGAGLASRLGRPVTVHNDVNATLYAIARRAPVALRPAAGPEPVHLLLSVGTGLGGAILVGDRILVGENGFAAELGHILVDPADERRCVCGGRGCVEQFASGRGLEELAQATPRSHVSPTAGDGLPRPRVSARDLVDLARRDDPWASGLLATAGTMLGRAIAILCVTLDPATVTIGGSLGHAASRWLLPAAEREMRERWTYAAERPLPSLAVDPVGPFAAATGAAMLAAASTEENADE